MSETLERLGVSTSRALLVTASDAGLTYGVNEGVRQALTAGFVTDASLLVTGPFAREAGARLGGNHGVQVALSAEHELLEMRPVTYSPSLFGGRGGFPLDANDASEHADPDEVHREFRAQIERARMLGVDPTFLASHDDVVAQHLALCDVCLDVAEEYGLPIRHGYDFGSLALDAGKLARARGHFVADATINWSPQRPLHGVLANLQDGVTEIIVHPALGSPDVESVLGDAAQRVATLEQLLAVNGPALAHEFGYTPITWRQIGARRA